MPNFLQWAITRVIIFAISTPQTVWQDRLFRISIILLPDNQNACLWLDIKIPSL
jgi:hypothetical protein